MIPHTIAQFTRAFEAAKPGEEIVYFRGYLDRIRHGEYRRYEGSLDVARLAFIMGTARGVPVRAGYTDNCISMNNIECGTGEAGLVQRRLGENDYEYVIQKVAR